MWFLVKCALAFALLYLFINANEPASKTAPPPQAKTLGERRVIGAKESPAAALQRAAAEKIAEAAREHCLANPRDCLELLKAASVETTKRDGAR